MGKSILPDMSWFKGSVFGRHPQTGVIGAQGCLDPLYPLREYVPVHLLGLVSEAVEGHAVEALARAFAQTAPDVFGSGRAQCESDALPADPQSEGSIEPRRFFQRWDSHMKLADRVHADAVVAAG